MGKVSMKGVCDMHVHTNPDLRLRAYDDFELADAAIRVGARAIVIKTHLGFTVNRAYLTNQYVKRVYGENTGFTMYGGVVMNKVIGGINPEAVEKGLKLGAKEIWLPTQSAKRHLEKMGKNPVDGIELVRDGKVVPELLDVFKLVKDHDAVLGTAHVSPEEAFVVVEAARNAGVKKIVITHPEWWVVDMSMDDQVRLVKDYDVILERCYAQNIGDRKSSLGTGIGRVYAVSGRSRNSGRAGLLYDKNHSISASWNRRIGGSENVKCCHYFCHCTGNLFRI